MRLVFLALFLVSACTTTSENSEKEQKKTAALLNFEEKKSYDLGNGLFIKNVKIQSSDANDLTEGIKVKFVVDPTKEAIKALHDNDYSAFFINISTEVNTKSIFSFVKKARKMYNENVPYNKAPFIAAEGPHYFEKIVPFNALGLPQGPAEANLVVQVFPVKFGADSSLKNLRKLKLIEDNPIAEKGFNKSFEAPVLFKNRIAANGFNLPENLNKKFDFTLTGRGLPDLFWEIKCGEEVIFSSNPVKNTLNYSIPSQSQYFTCSQNDKITISFYDFDQGPFNSRDLIEEWTGTIGELKKSSFDFSLIKNFNPEIESFKKN